MEQISIRPLRVSDFTLVVDMLKKAKKTTGDRLSTLIVAGTSAESSQENTEAKIIELGIVVLSELYDALLDDMVAWFADLCKVSKDEFLAMPLNTAMDVIEWLANDPENARFFMRAWQLYKKTGGLVTKFTNG